MNELPTSNIELNSKTDIFEQIKLTDKETLFRSNSLDGLYKPTRIQFIDNLSNRKITSFIRPRIKNNGWSDGELEKSGSNLKLNIKTAVKKFTGAANKTRMLLRTKNRNKPKSEDNEKSSHPAIEIFGAVKRIGKSVFKSKGKINEEGQEEEKNTRKVY